MGRTTPLRRLSPYLPFTIHRLPLTACGSSSLVTRHLSRVTDSLPFTVYDSPFTTHRLPLTVYCSSSRVAPHLSFLITYVRLLCFQGNLPIERAPTVIAIIRTSCALIFFSSSYVHNPSSSLIVKLCDSQNSRMPFRLTTWS